MGAYGHENHWRNGTADDGKLSIWGNDDTWETDFRHPDFGGDSLRWTDDVHFFWFQSHGGIWSDEYHITFSKKQEHCIGGSKTWRLGSKNLKWSRSCHVLHGQEP